MSLGGDKYFKEPFDYLDGAANAVVENRSANTAAFELATTPDANDPTINIAELLESIPVFDNGDNLCHFVNEIDRLFDQTGKNLTPGVRFLINASIKSYKLKGEPRDVCEEEMDWPSMKRVLLKKYGAEEEILKTTLTLCCQKIGDSYMDFYCNILEMYSSLIQVVTLNSKDRDVNLKISEYNKLAVETFKNGLLDPYKENLSRFDLSTLEECKKKCKVFESKLADSVKSQDSLPLSINLNASNGVKSNMISQRSNSLMPKTSANELENCITTIVNDSNIFGREIPYVNGKEIYLKINNSMMVDEKQEKIYFLKKDGEKCIGLSKGNTIIIFDKEYEIDTIGDDIVPGTEISIKKNPPIKKTLKYERVRVLYSKGGQVMGLSEDNRLVLTRDKNKINIDHLPGIPGKFRYFKWNSPWMRDPQYEKVRVLHTSLPGDFPQSPAVFIFCVTEDFRVLLNYANSEISPDDLRGVQDEIFIRKKRVIDTQYERVRVFIQEGNVILGTTEDNRVIVTGIQNANKLINDPDCPLPSTVMTFNRTSDNCISHCLKYCDYIAGLLSEFVDHDTSMDAQDIDNGRQLPVSHQMVARDSAQAAVEIQTDELPDVKNQYIYITRNTSMMSDDMHKMYFIKEERGKMMGLTKDNRVVIIDEKHTINTYGHEQGQCKEIYMKNPPINNDLVCDRIRVFYRKGGNIMGLSEDNRVAFMREKDKFNIHFLSRSSGVGVKFLKSNSPWMRNPQYERVLTMIPTLRPLVGLTEDYRLILGEENSEFKPNYRLITRNDDIFIRRDNMADSQYERVRVFIQEGNVILGTTEDNRVIVTGIQNANKLINDPDSPFPSTVMTFNKTSDICVSHCLRYFSEFLSLCAKPTL